jgi:hypothetical protein
LDIALEKHESVLISLFYAVQAVEALRHALQDAEDRRAALSEAAE